MTGEREDEEKVQENDEQKGNDYRPSFPPSSPSRVVVIMPFLFSFFPSFSSFRPFLPLLLQFTLSFIHFSCLLMCWPHVPASLIVSVHPRS